MKLTEVMDRRGTEQLGVVVFTSNGKFYDISFVDYNTMSELQGHQKNLGEYFIRTIRDNDAWDQVMPFFRKVGQGKPLGEDYSNEDADFFLFGPFTTQQLGMLDDKFAEYIGADDETM